MGWVTEGAKHDLDINNIFTNSSINDFLHSNDIHYLIASKGMGKTLLLRYKKSYLQNKTPDSGITILPENQDIDTVRFTRDIPNDIKMYLSEQKMAWKDLWEISIALSAILCFPFEKNIERIDCHKKLSKTLKNISIFSDELKEFSHNRIKINPSDIISRFILDSPLSKTKRLINEQIQNLTNIYRTFIRSGVYIFIDSVDQAFQEILEDSNDRKNDMSIWIEGQLGLLNASWEINRQNQHIKVYTSIRQEAFSKRKYDNSQSIEGSTLQLTYSKIELLKMFNMAIQSYEKSNGITNIKQFAGLDRIYNRTIGIDEDIFDYIYRHSLGTPRSLMVIGDAISKRLDRSNDYEVINDQFRSIVAQKASYSIIKSYSKEMSIFLDALHDQNILKEILRSINSNILCDRYIFRLCKRINQCSAKNQDSCLKCDHSIYSHPFCELLNIGLIGQIKTSYIAGGNTEIQDFKKPYEFDWSCKNLPQSKYFIVHPALRKAIKKNHTDYKLDARILVGDEVEWKHEYYDILNKERVNIFMSYSSKDRNCVKNIIEEFRASADKINLRTNIWFDQWKIKQGDYIQERIEDGLKSSQYMIVFLSKLGLESGWVEKEWRSQFSREVTEKKIKTFFILIDLHHDSLPELIKNKQVLKLGRRTSQKRIDEIKSLAGRIKNLSNK